MVAVLDPHRARPGTRDPSRVTSHASDGGNAMADTGSLGDGAVPERRLTGHMACAWVHAVTADTRQ